MIAQATSASTERLWARIIARAWSDKDFKQRLLDDPCTVLSENGLDVPPGFEIRDASDTEGEADFVLPPPPPDELTDEPLTGDAVAYCYSGYCGRCGCGCARCACHCR